MKNKTAIITGGSGGIGSNIALTLAKEGYNVVIIFNSDKSTIIAENLVKQIKSYQVKALAIQANVTIKSQVQKIIDQTMDAFGTIDVLINNAGITKDNLIIRMNEDQFNDVIKVNVNGVFNMTQAAIKPMMKQKKGVIINISSVVGIVGNPGQINYAASKAAVIGMTKTIAKEIGSRNIRCNAIAPGFIKTTMTDKLNPNILEAAKNNTQLKKIGQPQDIANLVAFLVSDNANYITGQVINVCGGMVI